MLLSRPAIRRLRDEGQIVIEPFNERHLNTASYDVSLGEWYFREKSPGYRSTLYNPYDEANMKRVWGTEAQQAKRLDAHPEIAGLIENGISPDDRVILIQPGETILGHTQEFVGGAGNRVCTMMKARSSMGRNFIEVCKCAGWGDIPYFNRWTMEITNNSRHYTIPLVVGRRIAQIVFFEAEALEGTDDYATAGKYQSSRDIAELQKTWNPTMMLPRMHLDFEARAARAQS